jgi:hypothetical protein
MVWGGLGWDYKTLLVFLTRVERKRDIYNIMYLEQILEKIVFLYYDSLRS